MTNIEKTDLFDVVCDDVFPVADRLYEEEVVALLGHQGLVQEAAAGAGGVGGIENGDLRLFHFHYL